MEQPPAHRLMPMWDARITEQQLNLLRHNSDLCNFSLPFNLQYIPSRTIHINPNSSVYTLLNGTYEYGNLYQQVSYWGIFTWYSNFALPPKKSCKKHILEDEFTFHLSNMSKKLQSVNKTWVNPIKMGLGQK